MSVPFVCPLPAPDGDRVLLAHGEGGRLSRRLIRDLMLAAFDNPALHPLADAAILPDLGGSLAFTTDGSVVAPLEFPGGDIGTLAIHAAVNDLAVSGAEPLYLSLGVIAEEGLPLDVLRRVIHSAASAARACGVTVVTGDTKVVPHGAADRLFLFTAGVGRARPGVRLGAERVRPGDRLLVSGTLGDHGIAILAAREDLGFDPPPTSDTAAIHDLAAILLGLGDRVRFLRDPTRGGLAAVCHELAESAEVSIRLDEAALPVSSVVRGACELLGLDPLFIACEGKLVAVVAPEAADTAVSLLRSHPLGRSAAVVGEVCMAGTVPVSVRGPLGIDRPLDEPAGAPLPRIC